MTESKIQFRDHFGRKLHMGDNVVFTKVKKDPKTEKKTAVMESGVVIELCKTNNQPSIKIEDMNTLKVSHLRILENCAVIIV